MLESIIRYMRGYVRIRVEGESTERFLNLCSYHNIFIWGLVPCGTAYEMYVTVEGFKRLRPVIRKTHTKVVLRKRYGFPFFVFQNRKRKLFVPGFLLCISLLYLYSSFIWDIHFEGNETHTDEALLEFLEQIDVAPAMRKSRVDCPQIVKEIREEYDDIVWVSVSIEGSRLSIHVKENEDTFPDEARNAGERNEPGDAAGNTGSEDGAENATGNDESTAVSGGVTDAGEDAPPSDLVAAMDGTITRIVTRSGVPLVHAGDEVKQGDVLVSGRIEVLNDAKEVVGYQYCQADADIYADTILPYEDTVSRTYEEKKYQKEEQRIELYLMLGALRISLGSRAHPFEKYEVHTEEYQIKLGENFYLPVIYGLTHVKSYQTEQKNYTERALQEKLTGNFTLFCEKLQEKGIQIRGDSVRIYVNEKMASAQGTLYLNQPIAQTADTEIIEMTERNEQDESIRSDN